MRQGTMVAFAHLYRDCELAADSPPSPPFADSALWLDLGELNDFFIFEIANTSTLETVQRVI